MATKNITEYLAGLQSPLREVGEELRRIIEAAIPAAHSAMFHGHPVWSLTEKTGQHPICLVKAYKNHVTFGLWRGRRLADESGRLVAGAREMSSVKLHRGEDVDAKLFTGWLTDAYDLETRVGA